VLKVQSSRRRTAGKRRGRRWPPLLLAAVAGVAVAAVASLPQGPSLSADPPAGVGQPVAQAPAPPGIQQAAQPPAQENPLDAPLRLLAEARQSYTQVRDYTCTLVTQERVRGKLLPENVIAFHFRPQPFSVYMRWLGPKESAGQEVCYVQGRNNGKMRVHAAKGLGGLVGFVSLDPRDPKVTEYSRHTIYEAGLGNMIEQFARTWAADRQSGKVRVNMAEYEYDQKRCVRVEVAATEINPQLYCYRSVVYFDKQTRLPIRVECYDWPRQGGPPQGELLEAHSYVGLRFNVGLQDSLFNK
jgi:hypothetical protein